MRVSIRVKVLYFGQAREAAGTGAESVSLPSTASVKMLVRRSLDAHERLQAMSGALRIAVNEEVAAEDSGLADGDTVAFLPPIAGG
jgi:molybdopterin converting factor subunit 1